MPDHPRRARQPHGERRRVADRTQVVGDQPTVGAGRGSGPQRGGGERRERARSRRSRAARAAPVLSARSPASRRRRSRRTGRAAAATIFSRTWAPPPPLISQPAGSTWSAPSIAMSSSPTSSSVPTGRPSSRAAVSVAGEVATQRSPSRPARCQRRQQVRDGRAGAETDAHPILDERGGGFGGGALLACRRILVAQRRLPPSRTIGRHGADVTASRCGRRGARRPASRGPAAGYPCPIEQSSWRARASWRLVSMPTAIARRPASLASAIVAAKIARRSLSTVEAARQLAVELDDVERDVRAAGRARARASRSCRARSTRRAA